MSAPEVTICEHCREPIWSGYWTFAWRHYGVRDHMAEPAEIEPEQGLEAAELFAAVHRWDLLRLEKSQAA